MEKVWGTHGPMDYCIVWTTVKTSEKSSIVSVNTSHGVRLPTTVRDQVIAQIKDQKSKTTPPATSNDYISRN